MARCSDCNKFVGLDLGESPELSIDVDAEGVINGDVTISRNCAECGTELKEGRFDINVTIPEIVAHVQMHTDAQAAKDKAMREAACTNCGRSVRIGQCDSGTCEPEDEGDEPELTIEDEECEATERAQNKRTTFYGFHATFTVKCSCPEGFEHSGEADDEMNGSEMEELN